MEQFFLRAVKAQLLVKANTGLFHRPALEAESLSLSSGTMAFLHSAPDLSLCKPKNGERAGVKRGHRHLRGGWVLRVFLKRSFIFFKLSNVPLHATWKSCDLIVTPLLQKTVWFSSVCSPTFQFLTSPRSDFNKVCTTFFKSTRLHQAANTRARWTHLLVMSWLYLHRRSSSSVCALFNAGRGTVKKKEKKLQVNFRLKTPVCQC